MTALTHTAADGIGGQTLNSAESWVSRRHGTEPVPRWWHVFRRSSAATPDLHALLVLLREHGAGLHAAPFTDEGGGRHGEALRAFLLAERVAAEQAVLRQAAAEAAPTITRRRL
ncbi:hypothetical protein PCE31106_00110 [Pandoraea cepalis]|uniref:Uncharacterized protein n=1 Tax=Pandoraea cepalis TaxID=2508294 RepID=A0A5E4RD44_9BURK|nr:hypothetical protein [Pandoraea cepalis]VVD61296.1 hypothetical protein PCE31106_00110 [Pandoraea cepalis]